MGAALEVAGISASYGTVPALRGVTLAAEAGQVALLVGRNGSGKSTTLKAVAGLVPIDGGAVRLDGHDVSRASTRERVKSGIAMVPQAGNRGRGVFPDMTIGENLGLMAALYAKDGTAATWELVWSLFPELRPAARKRAAALSGGQQQMLAIAMALMTCPRLLLLDEPTCGLARGRGLDLMKVVRRLAREAGLAVVIVEQNVSLTIEFVDTVYALRSGEVVAHVEPQELGDPGWFARML